VASEHPQNITETPLHAEKLTVWRVASTNVAVEPRFATILRMTIVTFASSRKNFSFQRMGVIFSETFFQQDEPRPYSANVLFDMLSEHFDARVLFNPFSELF
jgi:hypothetical protein